MYRFTRELEGAEYIEFLTQLQCRAEVAALISREGIPLSDKMKEFQASARGSFILCKGGASSWPAIEMADPKGVIHWYRFDREFVESLGRHMPLQFNGHEDPIAEFFEDLFVQIGELPGYDLARVTYSCYSRGRVGMVCHGAVSKEYLKYLLITGTVVPDGKDHSGKRP